jgi:hypothetical protein
MKKSQLRLLILEIVKKKLKEKYPRFADSFITSPSSDDITLYINVKIDAQDMKEAEKIRDEVMETLKSKHEVHVPERD